MASGKVPDMSDWRRVWAYIESEYLQARGWTMAELMDRTGVSDTTFYKIRDDGLQLKRRDKLKSLADGLGLEVEQIHLIARGEPVVSRPSLVVLGKTGSDTIDTAEIAQLAERVADLAERVAALERGSRTRRRPPAPPRSS